MPKKEKREQEVYKITRIYDTETSNVQVNAIMTDGMPVDDFPIAYPILFISNHVDGVKNYVAGTSDDIRLYRHYNEMIEDIEEAIQEANGKYIPIVCAYNLMFDMQPIMHELRQRYLMKTSAQSGTNVYTMDLVDDEKTLLRFWDVSHLEPRGLWAMGEAAGLEKAIGDWDYDLVRTPETQLTDEEIYYAKRDVQVIPAYLKYLLDTNDFIDDSDLGSTLITKTSLVRLLGKRRIGATKIQGKNKVYELKNLFCMDCKREQPKTFGSYALRKACFRGGLTFTAANYASEIHRNVVSIDAVSMHHAHITGATIWVNFQKSINIMRFLQKIKETTLEEILSRYETPFPFAFHAAVRLKDLRLKKGSLFERCGIACLAEAKFSGSYNPEDEDDMRKIVAEQIIRTAGYHDTAKSSEEYPTVFAYSKLMQAGEVVLFVNEIEWWIICQMYDFEIVDVLYGESATNRRMAPEYVTLMSHSLYAQKDEMKQILKEYEQGKNCDVSSATHLPKYIREDIASGERPLDFWESYYKDIIKGMFNSIYGSQAQNEYKPNYKICEDGEIEIDDETKYTEATFKAKDTSYVLYTYGMRIVGRSRLHLTIAMLLLDRAFGDRIRILGGDTDSIKAATDEDITDEDIIEALKPLHVATKRAIDRVQNGTRNKYPDMTSDLDHLGEFEVETYAGGKYSRYDYHIESWNKCRVSVDMQGHVHITCAGVSRPSGKYTLENLAEDMIAEYGVEEILPLICGYNTYYDKSISYLLGHYRPKFIDMIETDVTDYNGETAHIKTYQSVSLYPIGKRIGETNSLKLVPRENKRYRESIGKPVDERSKQIYIDDDYAYIIILDDILFEPIKVYKVKRSF